MQSLLPQLPRYTETSALSSWIKVNPAFDVKKVNLSKRGLLSSFEKAMYAHRELVLNSAIDRWNRSITPESVSQTLKINTDAYLEVVQARTEFLAPIERQSTQRATFLYGDATKRKAKLSKKKAAVSTLVNQLNVADKVMVFGPWLAAGIPALPLQKKHFDERDNFLLDVYVNDLRTYAADKGLETLYADQLISWGMTLF